MKPAITLVLDTNIVLDLLVFRDPGVEPLAAALREGRAACVTSVPCYEELRRVLAYDRFGLTENEAREVLEAYRAVAAFHEGAAAEPAGLPQCKDTDDQKFVELAWSAKADLLLTKDKALLALSRKIARLGQFRILGPRAVPDLLAEWTASGI